MPYREYKTSRHDIARVNAELHKAPRLNVIGAGVIGLMTAYYGLKSPYFRRRVRVYEKNGPDFRYQNASSAALAQALPLVTEGDKKFRKEQYEVIKLLMLHSKKVFRDFSEYPKETGVKRVELVELVQQRWPPELEKIMRAGIKELKEPVYLPSRKKEGEYDKYTHYYRCSTYSIDTPIFMSYLHEDITRNGGEFIYQEVTKEDLLRMNEEGGVIAHATGASSVLADEEELFIEDWGASVRYEGYQDGGVMLSADDLAISPTVSGLVAGGGSWDHRPNRQEVDKHISRLRALGGVAIKELSIRPYPETVLEQLGDVRIQRRPTSPEGMRIELLNMREPTSKETKPLYQVRAMAFGHIGLTVSPSVGRETMLAAERRQMERWNQECEDGWCNHQLRDEYDAMQKMPWARFDGELGEYVPNSPLALLRYNVMFDT